MWGAAKAGPLLASIWGTDRTTLLESSAGARALGWRAGSGGHGSRGWPPCAAVLTGRSGPWSVRGSPIVGSAKEESAALAMAASDVGAGISLDWGASPGSITMGAIAAGVG
jgi:hypothetical protein